MIADMFRLALPALADPPAVVELPDGAVEVGGYLARPSGDGYTLAMAAIPAAPLGNPLPAREIVADVITAILIDRVDRALRPNWSKVKDGKKYTYFPAAMQIGGWVEDDGGGWTARLHNFYADRDGRPYKPGVPDPTHRFGSLTEAMDWVEARWRPARKAFGLA